MQDHPVLAQVALGFSPMMGPQRTVSALRLTVFPERPAAAPDAAELLRALEEVWPVPPLAPGAPKPVPLVSLNLAGEALLSDVMAAAPGPQMMIEVPAFMAGDPAHAAALKRLHKAGTVLLIKGRPLAPLAPELLALFGHCILEPGEDRRDIVPPSPAGRRVSAVQSGVRKAADADAAFQRGAVIVIGWPWEDVVPPVAARTAVPSDIKAVMDLINGVEREEPVSKLEAVLRRDPTLAFRLMRYLNSPAFGLSVEVNSFGQALMLLGYQRLKRWLALLLVSSAQGPNCKPIMFAAVRRGLLMEELGNDAGDTEIRGELFICGVFSLLDRLLQQPMAALLGNVPVPERVHQALRGDGGPYGPYLDLVRAIEQESVFDIREQAETLLLSPMAVNRAVLAALQAARELDV